MRTNEEIGVIEGFKEGSMEGLEDNN